MYEMDLRKNLIYTDNNGRYRMPIAFYEGFDGERRVQYEKGYIGLNGEWQRFGQAENCSKKTFARWAKEVIKNFDPTKPHSEEAAAE